MLLTEFEILYLLDFPNILKFVLTFQSHSVSGELNCTLYYNIVLQTSSIFEVSHSNMCGTLIINQIKFLNPILQISVKLLWF